ncbi:MAG: DUF2817 domain-containing protein [Spirochaetes bacterium]|nr:DUF2817 domain-containing protein [Spirochaetota bacterium]
MNKFADTLISKYKMRKFEIKLFLIIALASLILSCNSGHDSSDVYVYHTPDTLETYLNQISRNYSEITYLEPAGYSVEGRTIWAIAISDYPAVLEQEPRIRLTGSIHGDENATTEVLIKFIDYILGEYKQGNSDIVNLVNSRYIVIIPMMNPDGVYLKQRTNSNDVDLNRNFSVAWTSGVHHGSAPFSESESQTVRDYSQDIVFHSSLTFHTGAVIVNMPFDYESEHGDGVMPLESGLVDYLALAYSRAGAFLETPGLLDSIYVTEGTINGGDWYVAKGTMQDWSYKEAGCIDYTVEISETRPETESEMNELFLYNRDSILAFIDASGTGVYGRVTDSGTGNPIAGALITIDSGDITVKSDGNGYYYRILLPDSYDITFSAVGYTDNIQHDVSAPAVLNVTMTP